MFSALFNTLQHAIYPIQCLGNCGQWDSWICNTCLYQAATPRCMAISSNTANRAIDILYALGNYQTVLLKELIHAFKYRKLKQAGEPLGRYLSSIIDTTHYTMIVAIPLHPKRLRFRGFNQSQVLANQFALPSTMPLVRTLHTPAQATLNKQQRIHNMRNTFKVKNSATTYLQDARILLIDDVYTTGATLNACAQLLKDNGAQYVDAAVIAID